MTIVMLRSSVLSRALPSLAHRSARFIPLPVLARPFSITAWRSLPPTASASPSAGEGKGRKKADAPAKAKTTKTASKAAPKKKVAAAKKPVAKKKKAAAGPTAAQKEKAKAKAADAKKRAADLAKAKREQQKVKAKEQQAAKKAREAAKKAREAEKVKLQKQKVKAKVALQKEKARLSAGKKRTTLHPPKSPQNPWGIFFSEYVANYKRAHPDQKVSVAVLTKEAAPEYHALSPAELEPFQQKAAEAKAAYPAIYRAWADNLTPDMIREENSLRLARKRAGKSSKGPIRLEGRPKRPVTGFMRFANEIRSLPEIDSKRQEILGNENSITEQTKLFAKAWKSLSESEREEYNQQYQADRARYVQEKEAFDAEQLQKTAPGQTASAQA